MYYKTWKINVKLEGDSLAFILVEQNFMSGNALIVREAQTKCLGNRPCRICIPERSPKHNALWDNVDNMFEYGMCSILFMSN